MNDNTEVIYFTDGTVKPNDWLNRIKAYLIMFNGGVVGFAKYRKTRHGYRLQGKRKRSRPDHGDLFAKDLGGELPVLMKAIGRLKTETQKQYAHFCLVDGWDYTDVARQMNVDATTVSHQIKDVWNKICLAERDRPGGLGEVLARLEKSLVIESPSPQQMARSS